MKIVHQKAMDAPDKTIPAMALDNITMLRRLSADERQALETKCTFRRLMPG